MLVNKFLYKVLEGLGLEESSDLGLIQSKMYLVQCLGLDLGFTYHWYGEPVSGDLLDFFRYGYFNYRPSKEELAEVELVDSANRLIAEVNALLEVGSRVGLSTEAWYSLLASMAYIYREAFLFNYDKEGLSLLEFYEGSKYNLTGVSKEVLQEAQELLFVGGYLINS